MNYNGYGYNLECLAAVGDGVQNQGYAPQGSYYNQPFRPPFNLSSSQGNFNQGYNSKNHVPYSNQACGSFSRLDGNRPYLQVPRPNPNLPYSSTKPASNTAPNHDYMSSQVSFLAQQNQSLLQINQMLITQMLQLQAQWKLFESQIAQMAHPPQPLLFTTNLQPNPSTQPPSPNTPKSNPNHHTFKGVILKSRSSYTAHVLAP